MYSVRWSQEKKKITKSVSVVILNNTENDKAQLPKFNVKSMHTAKLIIFNIHRMKST
jgi:hypothetical protein